MEALSNLGLRRYRRRPLADRGEDVGKTVEWMKRNALFLAVGGEDTFREHHVAARRQAVVRFAVADQHRRPGRRLGQTRAHRALAYAAAGGAIGRLVRKRQVEP